MLKGEEIMVSHYRDPAVDAAYDAQLLENRKTGYCVFCHYTTEAVTIRSFENFVAIENKYPYTMWEHGEVRHHWLIIPKLHLISFKQFSEGEKVEYLDIVGMFEASRFHAYTRGMQVKERSIAHHHTHLVLTEKNC